MLTLIDICRVPQIIKVHAVLEGLVFSLTSVGLSSASSWSE